MIIHSRIKDYEVQFHEDFQFVDDFYGKPNVFFVVDRNVYNIYHRLFEGISEQQLFIIDAIEENKTIDTAISICDRMTKIHAKRNVLLVSFGGGIIQDITGFAANVLYRGISWIFVPTTLLAACDSCIGGKTSLNYKHYKNLLGTFYPPDSVYISPVFFRSLSEKDFKSGMGEVVKFNVMQGKNGIDNIEKNIEGLLQKDQALLNEFVLSSLTFKKQIIEVDEFDKGERIKLNFAHTFGHAIETVSSYNIPHGIAIAIGTIMANSISVQRKILNTKTADRITNVLMKIIDISLNDAIFGIDLLIDAIRNDKKQIGDQLTAILMNDDGELLVCHDIKTDEIEMAIHQFEVYFRQNKSLEDNVLK